MIKYIPFSVVIFLIVCLKACTCKPFFDFYINVVNNTSHHIKFIPFRAGSPDRVLVENVSAYATTGDVAGCNSVVCIQDSIKIDSVQIIYDSTYVRTHYAEHIDTLLASKKGFAFNNQRNILNYGNYTEQVKRYRYNMGKCESRNTTKTFTFTEQDYIDAKK